jgi:FkbM family methyltransferase
MIPNPPQIPGTVVETLLGDVSIRFFVTNPLDAIQRHHYRGAFYEEEDLKLIADHVPAGSKILDVGSNVGNHAVYFAKMLEAVEVIAIEPNPVAYAILRINVALNDATAIDLGHLGKAFGSRPTRGNIQTRFQNNLGLGVLHEDDLGSIEVVTGDSVVGLRDINFIKIDIEGFEMEALAGLSQTIHKNRPCIYIEVDQKNDAAFIEWRTKNRYDVCQTIKRYAHNENYMLLPA